MFTIKTNCENCSKGDICKYKNSCTSVTKEVENCVEKYHFLKVQVKCDYFEAKTNISIRNFSTATNN